MNITDNIKLYAASHAKPNSPLEKMLFDLMSAENIKLEIKGNKYNTLYALIHYDV